LARPAGIEPTTPWFVGIQGIFNQLILLVANARRAGFRPYGSASISRKVAQKSRTEVAKVAQPLQAAWPGFLIGKAG